ncbi:hypothetical protein E5676_scaffold237G001500 [Cucumis melo var. makuwa]|uniref:Uncharacterized protein n=1 Tax=Cucumis melo var. makuwa TaxID=1194695 RepID=A0A5A7T3H5_CUCMM|nr:hypothetical protein E6C27_scaffold36G002430 [Cucumis melo var. makuwa]TYK20561.1 hypothetical protein E5676_scaffold237G001500 [Cucumis melo var. makuwa]
MVSSQRKVFEEAIDDPLQRGKETTLKSERNLYEMHLRSQKQLHDLELKCDNSNAHNQGQMDQPKAKMNGLKTHNQELKTKLQEIRKQNEMPMGLVEQNEILIEISLSDVQHHLCT